MASKTRPHALKAKKKTNTRAWEDQGMDKAGLRSALNPKPKFIVSAVDDPARKKRKAKPKDPKRGLKAGEMRGTTSQRKKAQASIGAARAARRRTTFLGDN